MSINIREQFNQYPPDMQQWLINQEKTKLIRIETALKKGKNLYQELEKKGEGKWLFETIKILGQYLEKLPQKNSLFEEVSSDYIFQVWELLENDSELNQLISQVETRYQELLRL
ncbi:hypothetical protein [Aphanothece sacrum]|uniref:ArsR family transcriptional regulator n=1 Tax=Aphanothece sacrum FPU1 TaxID=1920663 RepID=A0A401IIA0_APHSA|nr:hypothetical protein [Aphanothece sacrum]GBF80900.1 ArsR family transcriptional regulator [Aphanothece sacrum FPU1]GBF85207.1 ArsR family transcriptional regulator [Aphanothece sacrum FPU3]